VKRDTMRALSEMSLSTTAATQLANLIPMEITVTDAHREKEGSSDSFISYQVNTKVNERSTFVQKVFQLVRQAFFKRIFFSKLCTRHASIGTALRLFFFYRRQ